MGISLELWSYHEQEVLIFVHHLMEFGQELISTRLEFVLILLRFGRRWIQFVIDMIAHQPLTSVALILERRPALIKNGKWLFIIQIGNDYIKP